MYEGASHSEIALDARLLCDGEAVGERVERLFVLPFVEELLGLREQVRLCEKTRGVERRDQWGGNGL